jgi:hypothetical protein
MSVTDFKKHYELPQFGHQEPTRFHSHAHYGSRSSEIAIKRFFPVLNSPFFELPSVVSTNAICWKPGW